MSGMSPKALESRSTISMRSVARSIAPARRTSMAISASGSRLRPSRALSTNGRTITGARKFLRY
jgi:hypothetical protein